MQDLEICLPTDLPTTEGYFSFQWSFKTVAFLYCNHRMKYYCFRVSFSVLIFKTKLFINLVFGWGKCRTNGFIDGCVSCRLLRWTTGKIFCNNISKFYILLFVFFHCRHKMKYSCYQESSVIRLFGFWVEESYATGCNESESWNYTILQPMFLT